MSKGTPRTPPERDREGRSLKTLYLANLCSESHWKGKETKKNAKKKKKVDGEGSSCGSALKPECTGLYNNTLNNSPLTDKFISSV